MSAVDATGTRARIVDDVCGRLIAGESVAAIFREPGEGYPHYATFWRWLSADAELDKQVFEAERVGCIALADRMLDVARECRQGEIVTIGPKGTERKIIDMVDRSRLEVDATKWILARRWPKRYGDRTTIAGDAENPIAIVDQSTVASKLLPELAAAGATASPGEPDTD